MRPIELAGKLGRGDLSIDSTEAKVGLEINDLFKLASHESADVRAGVATLLSRAEPSPIVQQIFSTLLDDAEPRVIAESLWALEDKPGIALSCVDKIVKCLKNQDWKIRLPAATVLRIVAHSNVHSASLDWQAIMHQTASDNCEAVRSEAAGILGSCELSQKFVESLLKQLYADESFDVRRAALRTARKAALPFDSVRLMIKLGLHDASYEVRIEACKLAGRHTGAKIQFASALKLLVESTDDELRNAAARALADE